MDTLLLHRFTKYIFIYIYRLVQCNCLSDRVVDELGRERVYIWIEGFCPVWFWLDGVMSGEAFGRVLFEGVMSVRYFLGLSGRFCLSASCLISAGGQSETTVRYHCTKTSVIRQNSRRTTYWRHKYHHCDRHIRRGRMCIAARKEPTSLVVQWRIRRGFFGFIKIFLSPAFYNLLRHYTVAWHIVGWLAKPDTQWQ